MEEIAISTFKVKCLALLERVRRTGEPLLVTRRGLPVAQVLPPPVSAGGTSAFGSMRDRSAELADIVEPLPVEDWEALR